MWTRDKENRQSSASSTRKSKANLDLTHSKPASSRDGGMDLPESATAGLSEEEKELVLRLAQGMYHLPGNNCWQDWLQYFGNNHPLFSICFQHRLHPISYGMRAVGLLGSIAFGLAVTNIIWLIFFYGKEEEPPVFVLSASGVSVQNTTEVILLNANDAAGINDYTRVEVTTYMIVLWTAGATLHGVFDNTIWYMTSCACCLFSSQRLEWMQKCRRKTNVLVILFVVLVVAISTLVVVLRATLQSDDQEYWWLKLRSASVTDDNMEIHSVSDSSNYEFLVAYAVELAMAWFVHYPIVERIFFSGILGCKGRIKCWSGRPYEVAQEEAKKSKGQRRRNDDAV